MIGPLSVVLRWTITYRDVLGSGLGFMLYSHNVNSSGPVVLVANISVSEAVPAGNFFMYNITGVTVQPFTQYTFRVVSCNVIGCSDQSSESPVVQTLEYSESQQMTKEDAYFFSSLIASSPPQNVMITATTSNTLSVQWEAPMTPNGIIAAYRVCIILSLLYYTVIISTTHNIMQVMFNGSNDYNATFSQTGNFVRQLPALQMNTNEGTIGVVIEGLVAGTTYTVVIQAVNGAMRNNGLGMASDLITATTDSGKCVRACIDFERATLFDYRRPIPA